MYIVRHEPAELKADERFAVIEIITGRESYDENTVARTHEKQLANDICFALNNNYMWVQH